MKIQNERIAVKVVCMGDSITEGFGLGGDSSLFYPGRLQKMLGEGYEVFNQGVSGSCVTNTRNIDGDIVGMPYVMQDKYKKALELKGDVYIILLGTNDAQDGRYDDRDEKDPRNIIISYEKQFKSFYQDIIDAVKVSNSNAKICIVKPIPVLNCIWKKHQQKYLDILFSYFSEILKDNPECNLIDLYKVFLNYKERPLEDLYLRDRLHPNIIGAELIARTVYKVLKEQL